jgi:hypothetical protein
MGNGHTNRSRGGRSGCRNNGGEKCAKYDEKILGSQAEAVEPAMAVAEDMVALRKAPRKTKRFRVFLMVNEVGVRAPPSPIYIENRQAWIGERPGFKTCLA